MRVTVDGVQQQEQTIPLVDDPREPRVEVSVPVRVWPEVRTERRLSLAHQEYAMRVTFTTDAYMALSSRRRTILRTVAAPSTTRPTAGRQATT